MFTKDVRESGKPVSITLEQRTVHLSEIKVKIEIPNFTFLVRCNSA